MSDLEHNWDRVQKSLSWFRGRMQHKLWVHRTKRHWMMAPEFNHGEAFFRLEEEVRELTEALYAWDAEYVSGIGPDNWATKKYGHHTAEDVVNECADVANFAMMIAELVMFKKESDGTVQGLRKAE